MSRKICSKCQQRPVAINYKKNDRIYYRTQCDHCSKKRRDGIPLWVKAGYKKKSICDRCGFNSKYSDQFSVFHIDGNLQNCRFPNLKTICANCQRILHIEDIKWRKNDINPDF